MRKELEKGPRDQSKGKRSTMGQLAIWETVIVPRSGQRVRTRRVEREVYGTIQWLYYHPGHAGRRKCKRW